MMKFLYEDMVDAIKKLKAMGRDVTDKTITRKDLLALTKTGANWSLDTLEMDQVTNNTPTPATAVTKPNRMRAPSDTQEDSPIDLQGDTDFTDSIAFPDRTKVDDFTATDVVSRVADALATKLSTPEYRSMSPDELKAALEIELKNYLR